MLRILATGKADPLFTSESIPREIVDMVVIRNDRIAGKEKAIQAYVDAHYDVMRYFSGPDTSERAIKAMTVALEAKGLNRHKKSRPGHVVTERYW